MASGQEQRDRDVDRPTVTRCQLLWAALFLLVASAVGWFLILHFLP